MENNPHASNSSNLKLNSISSANDCQKAKLVELIAESAYLAFHGAYRDKVSHWNAVAIAVYNALLSAGALVQGNDHIPDTRKMVSAPVDAQGGGDFHYTSVLKWAISEPRKPANLSFSEGPERTAAYLIEQYDSARERGCAEPKRCNECPDMSSALQHGCVSTYPTAPRTEPDAGELVGALRNSNIELAAAREHVSSLIGREMIDLRMDANAKTLAAYEAATKTEGGANGSMD